VSPDAIIEAVAKAIWEDQRSRLKSQDGIAARATWRSASVPYLFWEGYMNDARAAIAAFRSLCDDTKT
jgi:hypothetical protein